MPISTTIDFDNSFAQQMEGFYITQPADKVPSPILIEFNQPLAVELGLDVEAFKDEQWAVIFSGNDIPQGAASLAQVYAGHQFGGFSPQLGDGRALLIGEVIDINGNRRDIQLKGSGRTPFSRGGDGKAVLGPVLLEYLMGEAMHALGVPTTRALAAVSTGEDVLREKIEKGAILTRVASSHLRVGTFQFFAARGETDKVKQLADYAIKRHYPNLAMQENPYLDLLKTLIDVQASLVAKWVSLGFVHGVMNTDNMTISGETIDYGPCAFIDAYDPKAVFSSIDTHGRYAYGNQPIMAQWNLARFAETLIRLINPQDTDKAVLWATDALNAFPETYQAKWLHEMRAKLGLTGHQEEDADLINAFHSTLEGQNVDFTLAFRKLSSYLRGEDKTFLDLFDEPDGVKNWLVQWRTRLQGDGLTDETRAQQMDRANPIYIPRNHKVEEALQAASNGDFTVYKKLLSVLSSPYEQRADLAEYENPAPADFGPHITYCGT